MKKTVKMLTISLIFALVFGGSACQGFDFGGDKGGSSDVVQTQDDVSNVFEDGWYILGDWENYEQTIQLIQGANFGKIIQSNEYVTRGEQSLRLEVFGYSYFWGYSDPGLRVNTDDDYFQKQDFSDCDAFAFDMYSVMDYDLTIKFSVTPVSGTAVTKKLTVKPGWNHFVLTRADYGNRWQDQIKAFGFGFDKGINHEETQTVYIDNFRARKIVE